ncbi:hypothetical protein B0H19DRAFT_1277419 [Mycena capillaripes]|nr:hypothetical protein B0H19DRAFT_1277419 [Mycena capillaripes]
MAPKSIYSELIYKKAPTGTDLDLKSTRFFKSFSASRFKLAALAVLMVRHPDFKPPTASIAKKCLQTLLPAMRFAMSTLDLEKQVPGDICVFFHNISTMIDIFLAAHPGEEEDLIAEYYGVPFPPWTTYPVFRADVELPESQGPSDEDLERSMALNTSPSRKRKGLSGPDSDANASESDESSFLVRKSTAPPAKKAKIGVKPVKLEPSKTAGPSSSASGVIKSGHSLRTSKGSSLIDANDDDDSKSKGKKKTKGTTPEERVANVIPAITERLVEIISNPKAGFAFIQGIGTSNFLISITIRQGNSTYQPKANLGAGPGSTIPRLEYEGYKTLPVSEAILPSWKCTPCSVLKEECAPHGLGVPCACCVRKKLSTICDHAFDATDLALAVANFQEPSDLVKPSAGPLDLPELQKLAQRATDASELAADLRSDFYKSLDRFLRAVHKSNSTLGTDGLGSLYASDTPSSVRDAFNELISCFNHAIDPTASDSEEDGEASDDGDEEMPAAQSEGEVENKKKTGDEMASSPAAEKNDCVSIKMEFYEDYIPLVEQYPYTFRSPQTRIIPVSTVSMSTFVPPARLEDQWEDLLETQENFMSSNPTKLTRKAASLVKIATAWAPFLDVEVMKAGMGKEPYPTMLFAADNKAQQYIALIDNDPDMKEEYSPDIVAAFMHGAKSFRGFKVTGFPAAPKTSGSSKLKPSSSKRARSPSIDISDVESVAGVSADNDVHMEDVSKKPKIETLPDPPTDTDEENEKDNKSSKKKPAVTRSKTVAKADSTAKAVVPSSKKTNVAAQKSPQKTDDGLSYEDILKILEQSNRLLGNANKIPHTNDAIQRMDSALRTHLSQIAIRISIETAKYDAVFVDYNRIRDVMKERGVSPKDHIVFDPGNTSKTTSPPLPSLPLHPEASLVVVLVLAGVLVAVAVKSLFTV